jgi:hypothetical protein
VRTLKLVARSSHGTLTAARSLAHLAALFASTQDVAKLHKKLDLLIKYQQTVQQEQRNFLTMAGTILLSYERNNRQLAAMAQRLMAGLKAKKSEAIYPVFADLSKSNRASPAPCTLLVC